MIVEICKKGEIFVDLILWSFEICRVNYENELQFFLRLCYCFRFSNIGNRQGNTNSHILWNYDDIKKIEKHHSLYRYK